VSAFYAVAFADHIELLTDGAVYEDDGTLTDIRRKVWTSGRHPIATTGRGDSATVEAFATVMLFRADLVDTVDVAIAEMQSALDRQRDRREYQPFEMVVCAISETGGPRILYVANQDAHGIGIEPWMIVDAGPEFGGGPAAVDVHGLDASEGLRGLGAELFDRMRQLPGPNPAKPDAPWVHGVGGHVDWTAITPAGCVTERIHEWPDVVGVKIVPEGMRAVA
jgi:hypothetical protein